MPEGVELPKGGCVGDNKVATIGEDGKNGTQN